MTTDSVVHPRPLVVVGDDQRARGQRRTLTVIVISQMLGGAGLAVGVSVGALLAQQMLGSGALGGIPAALFTLGSALAAYLIGRATPRWGRRGGLAAGFAVGGVGALGVAAAALIGSIPLLMVALFAYGAGTAANMQARYAGADLAPAARRGRAAGVALVATTIGAVAGPNLIEPMGRLASDFGIPALAGPFLMAGAAFLAAAVALLFLRPDPYLLARSLEHGSHRSEAGRRADAVPRPGTSVYIGVTVMILTQIAMIAIMTMTPPHMTAHGMDLSAVGVVIGLHIAAMYLPSLATGSLVDRVGRTPVVIAAAITLLAAGIIAALAPGDSLALQIGALLLLGLGWNFGLVAGTVLVVDGTVPQNRSRVQGSTDVLVALAGAGGVALSGMLVSATSFQLLSLVGGSLSLLVIPLLLWARNTHPRYAVQSNTPQGYYPNPD